MEEKQVIDLPGTRVNTLWVTVETGINEDGIKYEKRQQTAPKTFERCITDDNNVNLSEKLSKMQEQINGATSDVSNTVNTVIDERLNTDIAKKEETEKIKTAVSQISNYNFLINPDFKINQRNMQEYVTSGATQRYTFDRWKTFQGAEHRVKVKRQNNKKNGVYIEASSECWVLGQYIENFEDFAGKTVTISAKIKDMTGEWRIFVSETDSSYHLLDFGNAVNQIIKKTFTLSSSATRLLTCLHYLGTGTGWANVEWVKLELGDTATPYIPPDPATELVRCQRYYFANNDINYDFPRDTMRYYFPVTMRVIPTIYISGENYNDDIYGFYLNNDNSQCVNKLGVTSNLGDLVSGSWFAYDLYGDAEIY